MPRAICLILAALLTGCGDSTKPVSKQPTGVSAPKIPLFYATPAVSRDGAPSKLCYSVEGATTVSLDPPVEKVWPAYSRCFDVTPTKDTTYTLTAVNAAGAKATAAAEVTVGPSSVKIIEVSVNALEIKAGEAFPFCVKARNAASWTLSAGQWRTPPGPAGGCVVDHPVKTTRYVITAVGAMGETDTERVTATVR